LCMVSAHRSVLAAGQTFRGLQCLQAVPHRSRSPCAAHQ
jgi:hypothetical protein